MRRPREFLAPHCRPYSCHANRRAGDHGERESAASVSGGLLDHLRLQRRIGGQRTDRRRSRGAGVRARRNPGHAGDHRPLFLRASPRRHARRGRGGDPPQTAEEFRRDAVGGHPCAVPGGTAADAARGPCLDLAARAEMRRLLLADRAHPREPGRPPTWRGSSSPICFRRARWRTASRRPTSSSMRANDEGPSRRLHRGRGFAGRHHRRRQRRHDRRSASSAAAIPAPTSAINWSPPALAPSLPTCASSRIR